MEDLAAKLSDFLASPGAMEQLSSVMSSLGMQAPGEPQAQAQAGAPQGGAMPDLGGLDIGMILKIKEAYEQMNAGSGDDPKVQLLLALKPYMSDKRKPHIDTAIKFSKLSKLSSLSGLFQSFFS